MEWLTTSAIGSVVVLTVFTVIALLLDLMSYHKWWPSSTTQDSIRATVPVWLTVVRNGGQSLIWASVGINFGAWTRDLENDSRFMFLLLIQIVTGIMFATVLRGVDLQVANAYSEKRRILRDWTYVGGVGLGWGVMALTQWTWGGIG